ncbi:DUF2863 family protein [Herbaspirillum sp. RV1423]|uniref:DUF2863 family protein n=1 Tax=Herbaspirillum sp. RV1423 TaxID=1443993 RepID=UPI0004AE2EFA|nr:DUF2863 family protein [Herbaspirillum sp. RV1423]
MSKSKRPAAGKTSKAPSLGPDDHQVDDALIDKLANLAVELATEDEESPELPAKQRDLHRIITKSLRQQQDDVLYEALERARDQEAEAYPYLREKIEEAAEIVFFSRNERSYEVNAFVIPMFVRTVGGLDAEQNFRDADAFAELTASIKEAQLESPEAKVVLVSYAYHLDEIDAITYSHLEAMVRDAFAAMTDKKITATPAIDRSMSSWPANRFGADDTAVELRFLLGFTLKSADDPFYTIPQDEAAMDAYFAVRAQRFQAWSEKVGPLLRRCLVAEGREFDVHFLYQDLFHGGKERGIAEYFTLQMMSELDHGLQQSGVSAQHTHAVMGPVHTEGEVSLRVNIYNGETVAATADKPLDAGSDLQAELDDACDALLTMGVKSVALAEEFDADGNAVNVQPYA